MKASIALMFASTLLLAGCSRPVIKETVVPAMSKETVVERPAAAGASAPGCTYASQSYSNGSVSCQPDRYQYRCNNGTWERTTVAC